MKRRRHLWPNLRSWAQLACAVAGLDTATVAIARADAAAAPAVTTPAVTAPAANSATRAARMSPQQREGLEHFRAGSAHYKQGRYAQAVSAFERALDLYPNPTLLFNLAQAHRHNGSAENAIFFFKRYLVMLPRAPDRADVEMRIHYLEQLLATGGPINPASGVAAPGAAAATIAGTAPPAAGAPIPAGGSAAAPGLVLASASPPPPVGKPIGPVGAPTSGAPTTAGTSGANSAAATPAALPTDASDQLQEFEPEALINDGVDDDTGIRSGRGRLHLLAHAGLGFPHFGGQHPEANSGLYGFAGLLSASYAVPFVLGSFDLGIAASYSPLLYSNTRNNVSMLSHLVGGYATAGLRLALGESFSIGPTLALGVVWWSGIGNDNFFTASTLGTDGAAAMPSVRLALPLLWRAGSNLLIGIEPAWSYSKTTNVDLSAKTPDLRWLAISLLAGVSL